MVERVKFQVWGKHGWCTAYVKYSLMCQNIDLMKLHGIEVRITPATAVMVIR